MTSHESNFTCSGCHDCTCSQVVGGNWTNATLHNERRYPYLCTCYDFVIEAVLVGALCVLGLIGNAASIVCLAADKARTATPFLLISLELTDTLFLASVFPLRVLTSIHTFAAKIPSFGSIQPYIGKYIYPTALLAETGSIYLTILVTLNRYISVCHPYRATNLCSIHFARRHVVVVGLFSVVFNLPRFFEYAVVHNNDGDGGGGGDGSHLQKNWILESRVYRIVYSNLLYFVVMFLLPLVTLAILNTRLVTALRRTRTRRARLLKQSTKSSSSSSSLSGGGFSRSEEDITLMLVVVVMVFVVTQTPAMITQVLLGSIGEESLHCPNAFFFFERLSDLLVVANSSINFVIYCFCSRRFRQILFRLMTGQGSGSPSRSSFRKTIPNARATQRTGTVSTEYDGVCQLCSSL